MGKLLISRFSGLDLSLQRQMMLGDWLALGRREPVSTSGSCVAVVFGSKALRRIPTLAARINHPFPSDTAINGKNGRECNKSVLNFARCFGSLRHPESVCEGTACKPGDSEGFFPSTMNCCEQ